MAGCQSVSRRASSKVGWAIGVLLVVVDRGRLPALLSLEPTLRGLRVASDAETHVPGGALGRVEAARRHPVAVAVGGVAEIGAAADRARLAVEAVGAPFPDVAAGFQHADAVRLVLVDRTGAEPAVVAGVPLREVALPDVHRVAAARFELIAPGEAGLLEAAAGRHLPLGLVREAGARPGGEGFGVVPGDVDDGGGEAVVDAGRRTLGMAPVGAEDLPPPGRVGDPPGRFEVVRQEGAEDEGPSR